MSGIDATVASGSSSLDGVQEIEIVEALGEPTRYRVRLDMPVVDGDIPALANPLVDPGQLVSVMTRGEMLVNGPVSGHQIHLSGEDETSTLDVVGSDRLAEMDRDEVIKVWEPSTESAAVMSILGTHQFIPDVASTGTTFSSATNQLVQRGSDLDFVRRVARAHGLVVWVSYGPAGIETAHVQAPPVDAPPQMTLALHLPGAALDELDISWDADRPTAVTMAGLDRSSLSVIDGSVPTSPLAPMASADLAAISGGSRTALAVAPGNDLATLSGAGSTLLARAGLFVSASTSTTVARAGAVIHAHTTVTLDGIGSRHSGTWLVTGVRHLIDAVAHRMEIALARNGWEM